MNTSYKVESGLQLLARLTSRPNLEAAWRHFNIEPIVPGGVVEISGPPGGGKSTISADIALKVILPLQFGGCGTGVVVFNSDGNFNVMWILKNLTKQYEDNQEDQDTLTKKILDNLQIIDVYDSTQLIISLEKLEAMLMENPDISLVIFDTLTAFYWSDQGEKVQKMDSYLKNLLDKIQKVTKERKVTILYTKPEYYSSKQDGLDQTDSCAKDITTEKINCRIQVSECEDSEDKFEITINTNDVLTVRHYTIVENSIVWE